MGGIVTQVNKPRLLNFKPLKEALENPGEFLLSDFYWFDRPPLLHWAFRALDNIVGHLANHSLHLPTNDCALRPKNDFIKWTWKISLSLNLVEIFSSGDFFSHPSYHSPKIIGRHVK